MLDQMRFVPFRGLRLRRALPAVLIGGLFAGGLGQPASAVAIRSRRAAPALFHLGAAVLPTGATRIGPAAAEAG